MEKRVEDFLLRHRRIGCDSNVIIALVEPNPSYGAAARSMFEVFDRLEKEIWTSVLTIPEVLIRPLRDGKNETALAYGRVLYAGPFSFADIKLTTARSSTILGARYNLASHDALILSSLLEGGVTGFITAEKDFTNVKELEVLLLH